MIQTEGTEESNSANAPGGPLSEDERLCFRIITVCGATELKQQHFCWTPFRCFHGDGTETLRVTPAARFQSSLQHVALIWLLKVPEVSPHQYSLAVMSEIIPDVSLSQIRSHGPGFLTFLITFRRALVQTKKQLFAGRIIPALFLYHLQRPGYSAQRHLDRAESDEDVTDP